MKTCTKCGEERPLDEYHRDRTKRDGRRPDCRTCVRSYKSRYDARPEIKARDAAYKARPDIRARNADYWVHYISQPENRARKAISMAEYTARNPHIMWELGYRRRAQEYGFEPIVEPFTKEELIERHGDSCVDCGRGWTDVDHVVPVRFGGAHTLDNCEPVCHPCNMRRWSPYAREAFNLLATIYRGEAA